MSIVAIKSALQARLDDIAGFGGRVFVDRERAYADADLPCLEISFESADPERKVEHYLNWRARFSLAVCVKAAETARPDTTAETLLEAVQASLYAYLNLGGLLPEELDFGSVRSEVDANGERLVRRLTMDVVCPYTMELYGVCTDDFLTTDVQIDLASPRNDPQLPTEPDGQIDAAVTFNLPQ